MFDNNRFWLLPLLISAVLLAFAACGGGEEPPEAFTSAVEPAAEAKEATATETGDVAARADVPQVAYQEIPESFTPTVEPAAEAKEAAATETGDVAASAGVPQVAYQRSQWEPQKDEIFVIGADGSGLSKLLEGEHKQLCCISPGGTRLVYWSDEEIPNEYYGYVANMDGTNPKKFTPSGTRVHFALEESLFLISHSGLSVSYRLHDIDSGQERELLSDVVDWDGRFGDRGVSPDGGRIAFASIEGSPKLLCEPYTGEREITLGLLDISTGERQTLDGPLTGKHYFDARWSPNGGRLAFLVGPGARLCSAGRSIFADYDVYVRDFATDETKLVYQAKDASSGDHPKLRWSESGDWLLITVTRDDRELVLVDIDGGEVRQVARKDFFHFVEWAPDGEAFAYATQQAVYLESVTGEIRELASAEGGKCKFGTEWCLDASFGWSPDGRYIGVLLSTSYSEEGPWPTVAVLDTITGEVRTLYQEESENVILYFARWLP